MRFEVGAAISDDGSGVPRIWARLGGDVLVATGTCAMSQTGSGEPRDPHEDERPRMRAVVGSDRIEEEIFGRVFDGKVASRIWQFVRPYKRPLMISVAAVVTFTGSQLTIHS